MVTIGVDPHKRLNVAVVLDERGRELDSWTGPNSVGGWEELQRWASEFGTERRWEIEGAWNYGRGLAQHLVECGEVVHDVNPRWTAEGRRRARRMHKTDDRDAHAVATWIWKEGDTLPPVTADDETAVLDLLVTQRDGALAEATRLRNQIHQLLGHLDPGYHVHLTSLRSRAALDSLERYTSPIERPLQDARARAVRRLTQRLRLVLDQADELSQEIKEQARQRFAPLTRLCGVSLLTAGALAGILGPGRRFVSEAQLAAYAGVAPLEASSAGHVRHRLNRLGNRRLNAILYRMVLTQSRLPGEGRRYMERRQSEGKTRREAVRALKRHLVRSVWRLWQECLDQDPPSTQPLQHAS